jgi:hypothetical protein
LRSWFNIHNDWSYSLRGALFWRNFQSLGSVSLFVVVFLKRRRWALSLLVVILLSAISIIFCNFC